MKRLALNSKVEKGFFPVEAVSSISCFTEHTIYSRPPHHNSSIQCFLHKQVIVNLLWAPVTNTYSSYALHFSKRDLK